MQNHKDNGHGGLRESWLLNLQSRGSLQHGRPPLFPNPCEWCCQTAFAGWCVRIQVCVQGGACAFGRKWNTCKSVGFDPSPFWIFNSECLCFHPHQSPSHTLPGGQDHPPSCTECSQADARSRSVPVSTSISLIVIWWSSVCWGWRDRCEFPHRLEEKQLMSELLGYRTTDKVVLHMHRGGD